MMVTNMRKQFFPVLLSIIFISLLVIPTVLFFTIGENTDKALDEKRELTEFPTRLKNRYFSDLELWYNDHAPYRISLITFQKKLNQSYSASYRNNIHPIVSELLTPSWYKSRNYQNRSNAKLPFLAPIEDGNVSYGRDKWLFYLGDNSLGYYNGTNCLSEESMLERKIAFQELNSICNDKGIKLVIFSAPNKEQVYSEKMPSYYIDSEVKRELLFRDYMKDSGVLFLYPLEELITGKDNYETYYQQDTHWNYIGAYIGVTEIYKALGMPYVPLQDVEVIKTERIGGDLSNFCGYKSDYMDYSIPYKPDISVSIESYEDGRLERYFSSADTSARIVMVSDSFRSASKVFLTKDFTESTVLHQDQLEKDITVNALKELSEGDVLLLLRVERYDDGLFGAAKRIVEIMKSE